MPNRSNLGKVDRSAPTGGLSAEIGDWSAGPGPLYRLLATAVGRAVERGAVPAGGRLPAERVLAASLGVSRGTVVAAYDLLEADGFIERRRGSGARALGPDRPDLPLGREGSALHARLVDHGARSDDVVDLSISVLPDAGALPSTTISTDDLVGLAAGTGYAPRGYGPLRASIADLLGSWGLPTVADQVVITTGAQQAITAAAACWVRPGDTVVVDDPTYPGAIGAFAAAGAELVGVPLDSGGVRPDALARALEARPALVYLQSTLHSPTGTVLAAGRRAQIAALLADAHVPLAEDIALAGLAWDAAPPPIAAHAPDQPIAVIGSLSKLLWGGLRLGFVRAPEPVALRVARVKATHDLGSPILSQVLADRVLRDPAWPARSAARTADLRARAELLTALLAEHLPTWRWVEPAGGLSLWVQLPSPTSRPFAELALRHGVAVATADSLSSTAAHPDRIRLSFARPADQLRLGVARLAAAWSAHLP